MPRYPHDHPVHYGSQGIVKTRPQRGRPPGISPSGEISFPSTLDCLRSRGWGQLSGHRLGCGHPPRRRRQRPCRGGGVGSGSGFAAGSAAAGCGGASSIRSAIRRSESERARSSASCSAAWRWARSTASAARASASSASRRRARSSAGSGTLTEPPTTGSGVGAVGLSPAAKQSSTGTSQPPVASSFCALGKRPVSR